MARTTAADWIDSVDEALAELRKTCSQIFMTGLSMGGTLTLFTAASHADVIKGAIPINAVGAHRQPRHGRPGVRQADCRTRCRASAPT